jgi:hypothetical protein
MKFSQLQKALLLSAVFLLTCSVARAQTRPIVIQGGTLIDGTGRAPITDSLIVVRDGRFQDVGKRGKSNCRRMPRSSTPEARRFSQGSSTAIAIIVIGWGKFIFISA